jgi:hypothetical protein
MNPYEIDNTISGLNTVWADTIQGVPAEYFTNVRSNLQNQIDTIVYTPTTVGPKGDTGAVGPIGPIGYTGLTGPTGPLPDLTNLNNAITKCNTATDTCISTTNTCNNSINACNQATNTCVTDTSNCIIATSLCGAAIAAAGAATLVALSARGANGANGRDGENGARGDTGPAGPRGDRGDKGDKGDHGDSYFTQDGTTIKYSGTIAATSNIFNDTTAYISGSGMEVNNANTNFKSQVSSYTISTNYQNKVLSVLGSDTINGRGYLGFKSLYSNAPTYDSRMYDESSGSSYPQNGTGSLAFDAQKAKFNCPVSTNGSIDCVGSVTCNNYFAIKNPYSNALNYDSRITDDSLNASTTDGNGSLNFDTKKVKFNCPISSQYYKDIASRSSEAPVTKIGNDTEFIEINYQNSYPVQMGSISLTAGTRITFNVPNIRLGSSTESITISYIDSKVTVSSSSKILIEANNEITFKAPYLNFIGKLQYENYNATRSNQATPMRYNQPQDMVWDTPNHLWDYTRFDDSSP